jgi:hypothetical protein
MKCSDLSLAPRFCTDFDSRGRRRPAPGGDQCFLGGSGSTRVRLDSEDGICLVGERAWKGFKDRLRAFSLLPLEDAVENKLAGTDAACRESLWWILRAASSEFGPMDGVAWECTWEQGRTAL